MTSTGWRKSFLYSGGVMGDLGVLPGESESTACAINASGQVVGLGDGYGFLYSNGVVRKLEDMLDAGSAGYSVAVATGIADNGWIVANTNTYGQSHALLLTPNAGVEGTVTLQDFKGDPSRVPVTIEIRKPGTTTVVQTQTIRLKMDGTFQFCTTLAGTYDIAVKASHWLRKRIANVTLMGDAFVSGGNCSLVNGDVNGDDHINLADLLAVARAWRTKPGDPKYDANADLNGDGSINLADWLVVAKNWAEDRRPVDRIIFGGA